MSTEKLYIVGAGGHAKVVANAALEAGLNLSGFLSDSADNIGKTIFDLPILSRKANLSTPAGFHIAIGANSVRTRLAEEMASVGWLAMTIKHPSANIGRDVKIGQGSFVGPQAVLNPGAILGSSAIINSGTIVEHDCVIGDAVHLSPHVVLGGHVSIGDRSWIGIGATIRDRIQIGADVMIGAGSVVVADITGPGTAYGVPAKLRQT